MHRVATLAWWQPGSAGRYFLQKLQKYQQQHLPYSISNQPEMFQIRNIILLIIVTAGHCTDDLCSNPVTHYQQSDPELVNIIKKCFLQPPSDQPYSFSQEEPFIRGQVDQPILVDLIYNKSFTNGFFIEAGAWDGENLSNSLLFELHRGWTGLLVEPHREGYKSLLSKYSTIYWGWF